MGKLKIFIILILAVSINLFGIMSGNDSETAYEGENTTDAKTAEATSNSQIKTLIIEGAGYYLKSQSDLLLLLNKIEMSELNGLDYYEAQRIINTSIRNMENAWFTYYYLKLIAAGTPYNEAVISQLEQFDYSGFQQQEKLSCETFPLVRQLLSTGNVTGVYERFFSDCGEILNLLYPIKWDLDARRFPDVPALMKASQKFSETLLFGQYVTMVFREI